MILALDQGTSSTKACIFAAPATLLGSASVPVSHHFGPGGEATQDPDELVESCRTAARQALAAAGVRPGELRGVALANQGESFIVFDDRSRPLSPVISWQDTRCGGVLSSLSAAQRDEIERRTGLPSHAQFAAPKLAYQLQTLRINAGARVGTLDTWLINQLDRSRPHITDRATASRTMLIGLTDQDWNDDLLTAFGVPRDHLAKIVPCDAPGAALEFDGVDVPLLASGYDMGLALLGHGCLDAGETKATFGTCLGVMSATGSRPVVAEGLLTTIAYGRGGEDAFALDGEIAAAGALVRWAVGLGIAASAEALDRLGASVPDAGGVLIVPAIQGLGAPYWRDDVHGAVFGLTNATGPAGFARAVLEAIAWSLRDVLEAIRGAGIALGELRVDGGLVHSPTLMQLCADVGQISVIVGDQPEATAYGAAALGMLAAGETSREEIRAGAVGVRRFDPVREPSPDMIARWEGAVRSILDRCRVTR